MDRDDWQVIYTGLLIGLMLMIVITAGAATAGWAWYVFKLTGGI